MTSTSYRQVTLEEANAKATELNLMFMETSAKAGHNVKSLFKKIAMSLVGMEKEEAAEAANASTSALRPELVAYLFAQKSTSPQPRATTSPMPHNAIAEALQAPRVLPRHHPFVPASASLCSFRIASQAAMFLIIKLQGVLSYYTATIRLDFLLVRCYPRFMVLPAPFG